MLDEQRQLAEHLKRLGTLGQILLVLMAFGITLTCAAWVLGALGPDQWPEGPGSPHRFGELAAHRNPTLNPA
jgi:hypothetical protein